MCFNEKMPYGNNKKLVEYKSKVLLKQLHYVRESDLSPNTKPKGHKSAKIEFTCIIYVKNFE